MSGRAEVLHGFLSRAAQTAVSLGSAALVVWLLPGTEQGYYWAMAGLGGLAQVGELALTQVVLQTAAHHAARGEHAQLARFWRSARLFAAVINATAALVILACGFALLGTHAAAPGTDWPLVWVTFVAALAACQTLGPRIGFVEGAVSIADSWKFQGRLEVLSGAVLLAALLLGAGLWSLPVYAAARLALILGWLAVRRDVFPRDGAGWMSAAEWRRDLWPYQWKIAVTAVTSFLIYRAFTPIVFATIGPEAAARFGLSLAVMGSWLSITVAWPSSQTARIGALASQQKVDELRLVFRDLAGRSTAFAAGGALLILVLLWAIDRAGVPFAARSAGFAATALLLGSAVLHHVGLCASVLLRSGREDPLLPYSVGGSLITVAALWYAAATGDLAAVAAAYFACACLGLLMVWHAFAAHVPGWLRYLPGGST